MKRRLQTRRGLQQKQRQLDAEWKELERERAQIREDALREASQEIARLTDARLRAEARLEKVYRDWTSTEQKLEQYREFSEALAGRSAREILDELAAQKRRVTQLENQIVNSQDDQLQFENQALRKLRDEQRLNSTRFIWIWLMQKLSFIASASA
ncbi:hypothetical protein P4M26_12175 [Pseudomonas aeruginosa]|nr:hypothetical protein [Pseudomonas aeruginosa]